MRSSFYKNYSKLPHIELEEDSITASLLSPTRMSAADTESASAPSHFGHAQTEGEHACKIYYEVHYFPHRPEPSSITNFCNILMLHGLACTTGAWWPQLNGFMAAQAPPVGTFMRVCVMDNRGIGKSGAPEHKKHYSTKIMAQDALAVMKALNWRTAHIIGFSMGGMIATKLAAAAPECVRSLTLIGVTGGGWECIPKTWRGMKVLIKGMFASRSPAARARVDLGFHFADHTLEQYLAHRSCTRKQLLVEEYVHNGLKAGGDQEPHGLEGQLHACWNHKVTKKNIKSIREGKFPVMYIHGRYDLLAGAKYAQRLAEKMHASFFLLDGAHFITRECGHQVNSLLATFVVGHQPGVDFHSFMEPRLMKSEEKLVYVDSGHSFAASIQMEVRSDSRTTAGS